MCLFLTFHALYRAKSRSTHHVGECVVLFPSILCNSKYVTSNDNLVISVHFHGGPKGPSLISLSTLGVTCEKSIENTCSPSIFFFCLPQVLDSQRKCLSHHWQCVLRTSGWQIETLGLKRANKKNNISLNYNQFFSTRFFLSWPFWVPSSVQLSGCTALSLGYVGSAPLS